MNPTQILKQNVGQKFGWSVVYSNIDDDEEEDSNWMVVIRMGLGVDKTRTFVTSEGPLKEKREGMTAVSALALQGLALEIAAWEALPVRELTQCYESVMAKMELLDSDDRRTWTRFWDDPPKVVGIDSEGNQMKPPVLVQIATKDFVILETPRKSLSGDLERLLRDDSIVKVFCDNFAHKDKKSLGLLQNVEKDDPDLLYTLPPIVDIESLAAKHLGPVSVARGLGRIVALTTLEAKVRIEKPKTAKDGMKGRLSNVSRFAMIEQGKAKPLRGLADLNLKQQRYASLDAWCTLQVYHRLQDYDSEVAKNDNAI